MPTDTAAALEQGQEAAARESEVPETAARESEVPEAAARESEVPENVPASSLFAAASSLFLGHFCFLHSTWGWRIIKL